MISDLGIPPSLYFKATFATLHLFIFDLPATRAFFTLIEPLACFHICIYASTEKMKQY